MVTNLKASILSKDFKLRFKHWFSWICYVFREILLVLVINNVTNLEVNCYICREGKQILEAISLFFWSPSKIRDLFSLYFFAVFW